MLETSRLLLVIIGLVIGFPLGMAVTEMYKAHILKRDLGCLSDEEKDIHVISDDHIKIIMNSRLDDHMKDEIIKSINRSFRLVRTIITERTARNKAYNALGTLKSLLWQCLRYDDELHEELVINIKVALKSKDINYNI